ncbi:hypothetical protein SAMD00019534_043030, partial [Acytostelium subglobosum LB1]|uniref:hypothetical protein n=1 Tax=Acytostelium subglobosum LB1 TaxID=1410327 RepID=UPI0006447BE5
MNNYTASSVPTVSAKNTIDLTNSEISWNEDNTVVRPVITTEAPATNDPTPAPMAPATTAKTSE